MRQWRLSWRVTLMLNFANGHAIFAPPATVALPDRARHLVEMLVTFGAEGADSRTWRAAALVPMSVSAFQRERARLIADGVVMRIDDRCRVTERAIAPAIVPT